MAIRTPLPRLSSWPSWTGRLVPLLVLAVLLPALVTGCAARRDPPAGSDISGTNAGDAALLAAIQGKFAGHSEFDGVIVDVLRGRVLLAGLAVSPAFAKAAEEQARQVPGISALDNEIQIGDRGAGGYTSDKWLSTKIKTALITDSSVSGLSIGVITVRGVVYLTGLLPTAAERDKAVAIARGISGVVKVVSALQVAHGP